MPSLSELLAAIPDTVQSLPPLSSGQLPPEFTVSESSRRVQRCSSAFYVRKTVVTGNGTLQSLIPADNARITLVILGSDVGTAYWPASLGTDGQAFTQEVVGKPIVFRLDEYGPLVQDAWQFLSGMLGQSTAIEILARM